MNIIGNPSQDDLQRWTPDLERVMKRMVDDRNPLTVQFLPNKKVKLHWCQKTDAEQGKCMIDTFSSPRTMIQTLISPFETAINP